VHLRGGIEQVDGELALLHARWVEELAARGARHFHFFFWPEIAFAGALAPAA
jgi:hypothetical protein